MQHETPSIADDEARIRWLIERYYFAIDAKDRERMGSCFTEDALVVYHTGEPHEVRLEGRAALLSYLEKGTAWNGVSIHALSSSVVQVQGDTATAGSFAIAHLVVAGKVLVRGLRYDDQVVRGEAGWQIRRRDHRAMWQYDATEVPSHVPGRS